MKMENKIKGRGIRLFLRLAALCLTAAAGAFPVFAADGLDAEPGVTLPAVPTTVITEPEPIPEKKSYTVDSAVAFTVLSGNEEIELHKKNWFADLTGDGKFNSADARQFLRIAAKLEICPQPISAYDISGDGKISSFDARMCLRYAAKLDRYYCDAQGGSVSGFLTDKSGDVRYFGENGLLGSGYQKIENDSYYFGDNGVMQTGFCSVNGKTGYFAEDGKGVSGLFSIEGKRYNLVGGIAQTGYQTVDGKTFYFLDDGTMAQDSVTVNGKTVYLNSDCTVKNGLMTENGDVYFYQNGIRFTGWRHEGLNSYYFQSNGKRAQNVRIGDYVFDKNGVATALSIREDTLPVYLRGILKKNGTSPQAIYSYVHNNFRYKYYEKASPDAMVVRILSGGRGACYDYANLTAYLLKIAGYECKIIVGDSFNPNNGSEHDWVLVQVDGRWRHIDAQRGYCLKTDAEMRALGYGWNPSGLPAAN